jgi:hypothetical protein
MVLDLMRRLHGRPEPMPGKSNRSVRDALALRAKEPPRRNPNTPVRITLIVAPARVTGWTAKGDRFGEVDVSQRRSS